MATFEIEIEGETIQELLQGDQGMAGLLEPILNQIPRAGANRSPAMNGMQEEEGTDEVLRRGSMLARLIVLLYHQYLS